MKYSEEDIKTIAEAVAIDFGEEDHSDTYMCGWRCHFCGRGIGDGITGPGGIRDEGARKPDHINHTTDCPVLVARDILT